MCFHNIVIGGGGGCCPAPFDFCCRCCMQLILRCFCCLLLVAAIIAAIYFLADKLFDFEKSTLLRLEEVNENDPVTKILATVGYQRLVARGRKKYRTMPKVLSRRNPPQPLEKQLFINLVPKGPRRLIRPLITEESHEINDVVSDNPLELVRSRSITRKVQRRPQRIDRNEQYESYESANER